MVKYLADVLPKDGFDWPYRHLHQVTTRSKYDFDLQAALRAANITFKKADTTAALIAVFEMAATTVAAAAAAAASPGDQTLFRTTMAAVQYSTAWAGTLPPAAFTELLMYSRAARRRFLAVHGFDDTEAGSWGSKLGAAVDKFDAAVTRRGWGRTAEMLEAEGDEEDEEDHAARARPAPPADSMEVCEAVEEMDISRQQMGEAEEEAMCAGFGDVEMGEAEGEAEGQEMNVDNGEEDEEEEYDDDDDVARVLGMDLF